MAEIPKLLYIVVVDDNHEEGKENVSFRYTRPVLQSTLQLMGCKARHAFKISRRVFEVMRNEFMGNELYTPPIVEACGTCMLGLHLDKESKQAHQNLTPKEDVQSSIPFELYKRRTSVVVHRETFLDVVCDALSVYKYVGASQRADAIIACRFRERKESVTILLCGASGCGKSTLSALLGSRLGITTVISTDSIRHMMRSFVDEKQNPLLWASTYHAGDFLDPVAVAEGKAKRKAKKLSAISSMPKEELLPDAASNDKSMSGQVVAANEVKIGPKQMAVEGFKAQSEMVIDSLDRLITAWEERKESVIVEGVHLSLNFVMGLMKKHPSVIPFMVYIVNEEKHMERFAVRAKYMTLDPAKNKYVKYIRNIRTIQEYLCNRADKHLVPKINNTNVDKSVASIHATVFSCLRRRDAGEHLYDPATNTVPVLDEEYHNQCVANSMSSKGMFQLIQRKGSLRHLMALVNTDGSVEKAWPVGTVDKNGMPTVVQGNEIGIGEPMYGPLQISKAEPINLQFGNFGISAWPSDAGGTSHAGSADDSRGDGTETGSRYLSSCCSSPRMSDVPSKELKGEVTVSDSDEPDDAVALETDEDISDAGNDKIQDELEGSVDEESTKSDEEYDDLAMRDGQENGCWSDDEDKITGSKISNNMTERYRCNLNRFLSMNCQGHDTQNGSQISRKIRRDVRRSAGSENVQLRRRSQSIPCFSLHHDPLC